MTLPHHTQPPLFDRMKAAERGEGGPTLAELCKPLSALVMPRAATLGGFGQDMSDGKALAVQRQTSRGPARGIPKSSNP